MPGMVTATRIHTRRSPLWLGMQFFRMCRDAADSKPNTRAGDLPSWSSKGLSIFFLQSPPLAIANLKGLGHLFMVAAASIRAD